LPPPPKRYEGHPGTLTMVFAGARPPPQSKTLQTSSVLGTTTVDWLRRMHRSQKKRHSQKDLFWQPQELQRRPREIMNAFSSLSEENE
jgi:hypothetical protein